VDIFSSPDVIKFFVKRFPYDRFFSDLNLLFMRNNFSKVTEIIFKGESEHFFKSFFFICVDKFSNTDFSFDNFEAVSLTKLVS
jgi:hypothetical protein